MTRLRLVSWQETAPRAEDAEAYVAIRTLSPLKTASSATAEKTFSQKALLLAALAHIAAFGILLAAPVNETEIEKEPSAPMLVSLIAAPQLAPEPIPEPEIVPPEPPKPEPQPVVKQKPKPKPKVEPVPEPVAEPTPQPQIEESPPPAVAQQPVIQEAPAPQPVAAAPKVAEPEPQPAPVIEPPRFGVAYLKNPAPAYPSLSRRIGEEGRVVLRVLVATNGKPEKVEVEDGSGSERLDNAALDAVKKWQFIPARRDNQPISAYVLVPVKFSLEG